MARNLDELEHDSKADRKGPKVAQPGKKRVRVGHVAEPVDREVEATRPAGPLRRGQDEVNIAEEERFVSLEGRVWNYSEDEEDD